MSQSRYQVYNSDIVQQSERQIADFFSTPANSIAGFSAKTEDWLYCQSIIRRYVSNIVNGLAKITIPTTLYHFLAGVPSLWRGHGRLNRRDEVGPYSRRLIPYFSGNVTFEDLYNGFTEASKFLKNPPDELTVSPKSVTISTCSTESEHPVAKEFRGLYESLSTDASVYLHGSAAIGDYTAFSDIDDYVVVHESTFESIERFKEVVTTLRNGSELLQETDPLQHHGHWVFTDLDLQCLNQSELPLVALEQAQLLHGSSEFCAKIRTSDPGFDKVLWGIIQDTRQGYKRLVQNEHNLFTLKRLISSISLLPALVQQANGNHFSKKEAIERSSEIFSNMAVQAVNWATEIRRDWDTIDGFSRISSLRKVFQIMPFRRPVLERIAQKLAPQISRKNILHLTSDRINAIAKLTDEATAILSEKI